MRPRRVYVPLTHDQVRELAADRRLAAPLQGYAAGVPGRVDARISPAAAEEEAEYLAFRAAAEHAGRLDEGVRRVIASADALPGTLREVVASTSGAATGPVPVVIAEDLPLRAVASLHLDDAGDGAEGADATGDDEDGADGVAGEPDLLWYDVTELETVLGLLET